MSKEKTKALDQNQFKAVIVVAVAITFVSSILASTAISALLMGSITKDMVVTVYLTSGTAGVAGYILIHLVLAYLNKRWSKN